MLKVRQTALAFSTLLWFCALPLAAQDTGAECTLTFDSIWSAQTHPTDYPSSAHFSPLIGAMHNEQVVYWEAGGQSTPGVQDVAETGATGTFQSEINAQIGTGSTTSVISGGGIGVTPGQATADFSAELSHPLASVITMIAPSPDWFVGIHSLPLFQNGKWVDEVVVDLPAYDAGTDSGPTFTSPNQPTIPHVGIFEVVTMPFLGGTSMGTFRINCASDLLFYEGFESGGFGAWSSSSQ